MPKNICEQITVAKKKCYETFKSRKDSANQKDCEGFMEEVAVE